MPSLTTTQRDALGELRGRLRSVNEWLGEETFPFASLVRGETLGKVLRDAMQVNDALPAAATKFDESVYAPPAEIITIPMGDSEADEVLSIDDRLPGHLPFLKPIPTRLHQVLSIVRLAGDAAIVFGWEVDYVQNFDQIAGGTSNHQVVQSLADIAPILNAFPEVGGWRPQLPNQQITERFTVELICQLMRSLVNQPGRSFGYELLVQYEPDGQIVDGRDAVTPPGVDLRPLLTCETNPVVAFAELTKQFEEAGIDWPQSFTIRLRDGLLSPLLDIVTQILGSPEALRNPKSKQTRKTGKGPYGRYENAGTKYICYLLYYLHCVVDEDADHSARRSQAQLRESWGEIPENDLIRWHLHPRPPQPSENTRIDFRDAYRLLFSGAFKQRKDMSPADVYTLLCASGMITSYLSNKLVKLGVDGIAGKTKDEVSLPLDRSYLNRRVAGDVSTESSDMSSTESIDVSNLRECLAYRLKRGSINKNEYDKGILLADKLASAPRQV